MTPRRSRPPNDLAHMCMWPTGYIGSYFWGSPELSRASLSVSDDGDASEWRSTAKFINFLDSDTIRVKQTISTLVAPVKNVGQTTPQKLFPVKSMGVWRIPGITPSRTKVEEGRHA